MPTLSYASIQGKHVEVQSHILFICVGFGEVFSYNVGGVLKLLKKLDNLLQTLQ